MTHFRAYVAAYVFFHRDGQVYLMRRANTGYRDGQWSLPAGHVEEGESLTDAALREVREEAGLELAPGDIELRHAMYRRYPERTYADYFFVASGWKGGEPGIREPEKCDRDEWFADDALPEAMVPEVKIAWDNIRAGQAFSDINFK